VVFQVVTKSIFLGASNHGEISFLPYQNELKNIFVQK